MKGFCWLQFFEIIILLRIDYLNKLNEKAWNIEDSGVPDELSQNMSLNYRQELVTLLSGEYLRSTELLYSLELHFERWIRLDETIWITLELWICTR